MSGSARATAVVLGCFLAAGSGLGTAYAQSERRQSPRIVAFDGDAPEPAAAPPARASQPVAAPRPSRVVAAGRVVPPPPRVEFTPKPARRPEYGRLETPPLYAARPASASRLAVNSSYGVRTDPLTGVARMHTGVDLAALAGDSVGASMSGRVAHAGPRGGYGNLVVVDHGNGIATYYAHLSAISVAAGEQVEAGQLLGFIGSTGRATGPHLHYEVRANGHPLDPGTAITFDGTRLFVHGQAIAVRREDEAPALPAAPGGTSIAVDWGAGDGGTPTANGKVLLVDFE